MIYRRPTEERDVLAGMDGRLARAASRGLQTEISRGIDKGLWFVEAHQQGELSAE